MRTFLLLISCYFLITALSAQKKQALIPKLSPFQKTEIKIGIVDVALEYSRPSMRGRKIFGELVPYNEIWRTGANKNTKITFHADAIIENVPVKAGTYSLFTKPNPSNWEIYIYELLDEYGAPDQLEDNKIVARFMVPVSNLDDLIETLAINFESLTSNSAILTILWEKIKIPISIRINTEKIIQKELFRANTALAESYESAAWTYYEYEKDYQRAFVAINKCIAHMEKEEPIELWLKHGNMENPNRPRRYLLRAEILETIGNNAEALDSAKKALEIAKLIKSESYIKRITEMMERLK